MDTIKNKSRPAWKAVLSEAVVTQDKVLGMSMQNNCLEGSTSPSKGHSKVLSSRQLPLPFEPLDYVQGYDRFA